MKLRISEMAIVHRDTNYGILVTVNPDSKRVGDPYFKFYNSSSYQSATKVIRILFNCVGYVSHEYEDDNKLWKLNSRDKGNLVQILSRESAFSDDNSYTVWDDAKFLWNREHLGDNFSFNLT